MDVLAIILACSLHPDDVLVRTLVDVQSSGNVYFVGDLATLKTNDSLTSADAALRFAEDLRRHGGRPAIGLLAVPLEWAGRYGRAPIELFDACTNIAIGTAALAEYQDRCSGTSRESAGRRARRPPAVRRHTPTVALRSCVLASFARDLGVTGTPAAVLRRLALARGASASLRGDAPPERSFVFLQAQAGSSAESSQRIFIDTPAPAAGPR
jgi:hypothetical protein